MLTALFATYNGGRTLPAVLEAYCHLRPPDDGWKLVVVDNGSTDDSKQIICGFANRLPLTYVYEQERGKNAALNNGLQHIEGDLVLVTDDDAIPHPNWLTAMRRAADSQPDFSIFGGVILPRWEVRPEPWLFRWVPLSITYALTDESWPEGPISARKVFGPNSAYRARIFQAGFSFDPQVGPKGANYPMGSEHEFNVRLMKAGYKAWHCKGSVVEHIVRKNQMEKEWVLGRAFRSGRGYFRVEIKDTLQSPRLMFGIPRFILREALMQMLRVARARLTRDEDGIFSERWALNFLFGQIEEARKVYGKIPTAVASPSANVSPERIRRGH